MLPVNNNTSSRKVERELKKADKEYAKAERGFQKGSVRRAEKHENRGMAHELKAEGLTVGSHHGHNEATRVAMLHNAQLASAAPTIVPVSTGPTFAPQQGYGGVASTGFGQDYAGQQGYQQQGLQQQGQYQQQSAFPGVNQGSGVSHTTVLLPNNPGTTHTISTQPGFNNQQRF